MENKEYLGTWYFTQQAFNVMTEGRLDIEAMQAQLDANPALVDVMKDQMPQIIEMLNWHLAVTDDQITKLDKTGKKSFPYSASETDDGTRLEWTDEDGDQMYLHWADGHMTFGDVCALSRDKLSLNLPDSEAKETPSWVGSQAISLVAQTLFSTQADIITELVKSTFVEKINEQNKSLEALGLDVERWNSGLNNLITNSCEKYCADLDEATATELLIGLGQAQSKELEAFCRSDIGRAVRNAFSAHSDEIKQTRAKFITQLILEGATEMQSFAEAFISEQTQAAAENG